MSQYTGTNGSQYPVSSSNADNNFNGNKPISSPGFSSFAPVNFQYFDIQKEPSTIANFENAFEEESASRTTVESLGWAVNSPNMQLYSFRVLKSKEPYFELKSPFIQTPETPGKIYLGHAKYVRLKCQSVGIC
jgi:hypothetical protein